MIAQKVERVGVKSFATSILRSWIKRGARGISVSFRARRPIEHAYMPWPDQMYG
jgi:hypothetical protein